MGRELVFFFENFFVFPTKVMHVERVRAESKKEFAFFNFCDE